MSTLENRNLGARFKPDIRDKRFPMRAVRPATTQRTYRYWYNRFNADQTGGTCVANTWAHFLGDSPRTHTLASLDQPYQDYISQHSGQQGFRGMLYDTAQGVDEWDDTPPEEGTSVRAGAKALQEMNLISSYHWATSVEDVVVALLENGPVAFASLIYAGMYYVPAGGLWRPEGEVIGGHAYCLDGVNRNTGLVRVQTWGTHFKMNIADIVMLLETSGEACIALEP